MDQTQPEKAQKSTDLSIVGSIAEQVAAAEAPAALNLLAQKMDELTQLVKSNVASYENKHPKAAEAIVMANQLLVKLFPQSAELVTDAEKLDL